jgi:hypothetical protein
LPPGNRERGTWDSSCEEVRSFEWSPSELVNVGFDYVPGRSISAKGVACMRINLHESHVAEAGLF